MVEFGLLLTHSLLGRGAKAATHPSMTKQRAIKVVNQSSRRLLGLAFEGCSVETLRGYSAPTEAGLLFR